MREILPVPALKQLQDLIATWRYSTGGSMYKEMNTYFSPSVCSHVALLSDKRLGLNCVDISIPKGLSYSLLNDLQTIFLVTIWEGNVLHLEAFSGLPKAFREYQVKAV